MTRRNQLLILVALLLAACAGPAPTPSPAASEPVGSPPPIPSPVASPPPLPSPVASPGTVPPDASLIVPDGDPVVGQLGGYTWGDTGSDAPWLPGTPATVDGTAPLRFGLSFDAPISDWSARYAPTGDLSPVVSAGLERRGAPLEVGPPPPGTWSVAMTVTFAGGRGSATYYWEVEVP